MNQSYPQKFKSPSKPRRFKLWGAIYISLFVAACAPRPFPRLQDLDSQPWQKSQVDWIKMREELLKQHQKGIDSIKNNLP